MDDDFDQPLTHFANGDTSDEDEALMQDTSLPQLRGKSSISFSKSSIPAEKPVVGNKAHISSPIGNQPPHLIPLGSSYQNPSYLPIPHPSVQEAMTLDKRRNKSNEQIHGPSSNIGSIFDICLPPKNETYEIDYELLPKMERVKEDIQILTKRMSISLKSYTGDKKYTLYCKESGLFQSNSFEKLGHGNISYLFQEVFWLDVNVPTASDISQITKVKSTCTPDLGIQHSPVNGRGYTNE
jgi:hypothetical protein